LRTAGFAAKLASRLGPAVKERSAAPLLGGALLLERH
jgi:hypothetical protein